MFELIFIIIVIAVIVSKVKAQNQGANRNNTTYINGKPVKNNRQQVYGAGQMNRQPQNYSAINARSQFVEALLMAEPARLKPIQIMIGPVTTGGRKRITFFTPARRMIRASTR